MNKALINLAMEFAHAAHDSIGQKRKYTGEPYWVHTDAVAKLVASYGGNVAMIAAAHLHDWLEDVEPELIKQGRINERNEFLVYYMDKFPESVRDVVDELTHEYTAEKYPNKSRDWRKNQEALRLGRSSHAARFIKVCDFIHNTESIVKHDEGFAKVYLKEKERALNLIKRGLPQAMVRKAYSQIAS